VMKLKSSRRRMTQNLLTKKITSVLSLTERENSVFNPRKKLETKSKAFLNHTERPSECDVVNCCCCCCCCVVSVVSLFFRVSLCNK
jgi:hypothetical protein